MNQNSRNQSTSQRTAARVGARFSIRAVSCVRSTHWQTNTVEVGDFVMALDGQAIQAGDNYWEILNHTLNEFVPVQVADESSGSGSRDLRIRPVTSLNNIKYEAQDRDLPVGL